MTLLLPRRGFLAGLASLLAAPAIVRATSLDLVRGAPLLVPELVASYAEAESLNYSYWVVRFGEVVSMTARDILAAPAGVVQPWIPSYYGDCEASFRPTDESKKGLIFLTANGQIETRNIAAGLDNDPVIVKLRAERKDLAIEGERLEKSLQRAVRETAKKAVALANNNVNAMPERPLVSNAIRPRHGVVAHD